MENGARNAMHRRDRSQVAAWLDRLLIAACALAVYLATLAPSIGPGDSPELTAAVWTLGVAHPTGYPFYTLLGHAFARLLPLGSVAYRLNLFSALAMTGGLLLLYTAARYLGARRLPSLAAILLLAFTPTLWSQALVAEVYALHVLLLAAVLTAGLAWDRTGRRRWLRLTFFLYGLAFTHHLMSVLLAPGLLYLALTSRHRSMLWGRQGLGLLLCFGAPLLLYLYLPWAARADGPLNWGDTRTWPNFLFHVTGRQYRGAMFTAGPALLWERLARYLHYLPGQFGGIGIGLGLLGLWRLERTRRRWLWGTGLLFAANLIYALNYNIHDVEIYFIPSNCIFGLWLAFGLSWLMRGSRLQLARRGMPSRAGVRRAAWGACVAMPAALVWGQWGAVSQHDNWEPLEYGRGFLASLAPNAVLLGGGDDIYFPMLYARYVEGRRPDVIVASVFDTLFPGRERLFERLVSQGLRTPPIKCRHQHPVGPKLHYCYLRGLLADNIDRRPIYLVGPQYALAAPRLRETLAPYTRVQVTNMPGWRLQRVPPPLEAGGHPTHPTSITFRNVARFVGYDAQPFQRDGITVVRMRYHWELLRPLPKGGLKAWVMFTDAQGNYRRNTDGGPRFQNVHLLGQGRPLAGTGFPRKICETLDVVVPPEEVNREQRLRVALSFGERFLPPSESPGERFADAGSIGIHVLAAGTTTAVPRDLRPNRRAPVTADLRHDGRAL
jgi:Protein O-mannosyl-transferase TMEM260-like